MPTNSGVTTAPGVPFWDDELFLGHLSDQLNLAYRTETVIEAVTCTDHTAKLAKGGNKVTITGVPSFTIKDYVKGNPTTADAAEPETVELDINHAKEFNFPVYNLDKKQTMIPGVWSKWMTEGGKDMAEVIEEDYFADIVGSAYASNIIGTLAAPIEIKASTFTNVMQPMGVRLSNQSVTRSNRYCIFPPWLTSDFRFSDLGKTYVTGDKVTPMRNGFIAPFDNFKIYESNRLPSATNDSGQVVDIIIYGHIAAVIFFTQFRDFANSPGADIHSTIFSTIQVFGYLAHRPKGLGIMYVTPDLT